MSPQNTEYDDIVTVECVGFDETFDLEVDHEDHTFFANGISVSNSHAFSYATITYQCAHFLTYHPDEWITTYVDYCAIDKGHVAGQEDPKAVAIKEAKVLGYQVTKPDINLSSYGYTVHPTEAKTLVPGFGTLKHVGKSVVQELQRFRPYTSLSDLVTNSNGAWRHSKLNKRALGTLVKLEALESVGLVGPDKPFKNYKQLYAVLIDGYDELKRVSSRKKNNDVGAVVETMIAAASVFDDWTKQEKIEHQRELIGSVDFDLIVPPEVQEKLDSLGFGSVDEWEDEEQQGQRWAVVSGLQTATTKTGKPYLKIKLYGQSLKEQTCFVWNYRANSVNVKENDVIVGLFNKTDFGLSSFPNKIFKLND